MRTFRCACKARVFFDNTQCLSCSRELGFLPDVGVIAALDAVPGAEGPATLFKTPYGRYRKCANNVEHGICNWLVREGESDELCQACRLNNVIPNLSNPENKKLWAEVEKAKRRLVYSLNRLALPVVSKSEDAEQGLSFDIKADIGSSHVLTGHADGLITLNLAEADTVVREKLRVQLNERYRTLLGHFRHEVGHYYWERLIREADGGRVSAFRRLFGDETQDYAQALKSHYATEPGAAWSGSFISHYAAAHPWEDWAETFAHYLHMIDTLETAQHFGFTSELAPRQSITKASDFDLLMSEWGDLTVALNALNRSMGLPDAYPFAISVPVREKLAFVHKVVRESRKGRA